MVADEKEPKKVVQNTAEYRVWKERQDENAGQRRAEAEVYQAGPLSGGELGAENERKTREWTVDMVKKDVTKSERDVKLKAQESPSKPQVPPAKQGPG
jgi:hypothetical protein